jgi:pimeloyl-ACP methyl ester carboxylesterase
MLYLISRCLEDSVAVTLTRITTVLTAASCLFCALPLAVRAEIALEDCRIRSGPGSPGIKARCGVLRRHENPADESSALLALRVAVVPALSLKPEPDPFVPIAGGPGGSTIEFYAMLPQAFEAIRRTRDIVLLDQRGTGASAPMECDIGDEIVEGQFSREETIAASESCLETLPHDPRFFTTSVAVADLEALRAAMDYPQLNVYGISYGTRVAQHFARRYPDSVRTIILDGVVPPQLALGPDIAMEAQKALDAIFARCAGDEACAGRFPDISHDFAALEARLTEAAVPVDVDNPTTGVAETVQFGKAELAGAIRLLSYNPHTVALMPLLIHEAANGNYTPLAAQFLMIMDRMTDALAIGMHNAVVCTEDVPFYGDDADSDLLESTYIGPMQLDALEAICSVWPEGVIDPDFKTPLATSVPVLLLSGNADPVTPPRFGDLAAVDLRNAAHLTGRHQGHGQAATGCVPRILGRFVERASVAIDDLDPNDCLSRRFAMPFFLNYSGPPP